MIENNNISPMQSDFEQIKKLAEDGQEYWTSRPLDQSPPVKSTTNFGCQYLSQIQNSLVIH